MAYGFAPPPPKPPVSATDVTISVILLVLTVVGGAFGAFMGLFMLAFTDTCPPATCNLDAAVTSIVTGLAVAALVALVGTVLTIVRLVARSTAWPFALGTCVLCAAACVLGIAGYIVAVGG
ncbi:MAG: hypothetical protein HYZ38_09340 [Mycobacterium sp.]|nr:hypothetical protein [Mycobacterium sp.]